MDPRTLLRLVESMEFQRGVAAGIVAVALALVARKLRPDWGLLWLPTMVISAAWAGVLDGDATDAAFARPGWVVPSAILTSLVGFAGLAGNRTRRELAPALAISVGGMWATVPDTETIMVPLGVTVALIWVWWPRPVVSLGVAGAGALTLGLVWAGTVGAIGRGGAYVGAYGAIAAFALLWLPHRPASPWWRLALHAAVVLGWTRGAGLLRSATTALIVGLAITGAVVVAEYAVPNLVREGSGDD